MTDMNIHKLQNWSPPREWIQQESGLLLRDTFFIFNLSWPDFHHSAKGIWLLYRWAQCGHSGMCRTSQMKMQDLIFPSLPSLLLEINGALLTEDGLLDIYFTGLECNFFCEWIYWLKLTFSSIQHPNPNVDPYKAMFVSIILIQTDSPAHRNYTRSPALKTRITFSNVNNFASIFFPALHSTLLPIFSAHKVLSP